MPAKAPIDDDRSADAYQRKRVAAAARSAQESDAGRDIGEIPKVANKRRRAKAEASLFEYLKYFPDRFNLKFSDDQLELIASTQKVIDQGGTEPIAFPRGSGKTQICIAGVEWAAITGRRKSMFLVGVSHKSAKRLMRTVKADFLTNDRLAADFPEVCYPIRKMDGRANRCAGQHCGGAKTHMTWAADQIVLPTIAGSKASSAQICVTSLFSSSLRGENFTRPCDQETVRPELVILDDVQDDRIAKNPDRVEYVLEVINGTILGMAAPGKKMAVLAPCTVIRPDDVADQLLDRKRNPDWFGKIYKLVYQMPTNMALWDEYAHIRAESLRNDGTIKQATDFYRKNRATMDEGAKIAWPARFNPDELSAVQYAMNLYFRNPAVFFAEYQNTPIVKDAARAQLRKEEILTSRFNGLDRRIVPAWATHLVAFIDVQHTLLYTMIMAWADDFTGAIIDYGTWPEQQRRYFTLNAAPRPFAAVLDNDDPDGNIFQALGRCVQELLDTPYIRAGDAGGGVALQRILIDTGDKKDPIYDYLRSSPHKGIVMPSRGLGIGVKKKPLSEYIKHDGERYGFHWRVPIAQSTEGVKTLQLDTNYWKTFVLERLRKTVGNKGAISLFGLPGEDHRLLADHFTAEYFTRLAANGRELDEWDLKPGRPDNHWWDCIVGCAAAASLEGATIAKAEPKPQKKRRFKSYDEWREHKFGSKT